MQEKGRYGTNKLLIVHKQNRPRMIQTINCCHSTSFRNLHNGKRQSQVHQQNESESAGNRQHHVHSKDSELKVNNHSQNSYPVFQEHSPTGLLLQERPQLPCASIPDEQKPIIKNYTKIRTILRTSATQGQMLQKKRKFPVQLSRKRLLVLTPVSTNNKQPQVGQKYILAS